MMLSTLIFFRFCLFSRSWAIVIPVYFSVCIVFLYIFYTAYNFTITKPLNSIHTIKGNISQYVIYYKNLCDDVWLCSDRQVYPKFHYDLSNYCSTVIKLGRIQHFNKGKLEYLYNHNVIHLFIYGM